MKKRNLLLFAIASSLVLLTSFAAFYPGGAPAGVTGSPGDGADCSSCHGTAATTTAGWITSNIPAEGYTPGQTYQITATNNMAGSGKYGFEVSPQNSSGTLLGTLTAGTNSKLVGSGKYVTQSSSSNTLKIWTFSWTAPTAGTGNVTFYGAFARNYSGLTTLSTLMVTEQVASLPSAAGPVTGPISACRNSTATYSTGTINGATSYVWSAPAGASITAGQGTTAITVNYSTSAVSGNISVYGSNAAGNGAASNLAVTVNTVPDQPGVIAGPDNPCQGSNQYYTVTNASGVSYNWTVPSGSTITAGQGTNSITVSVGATSGNIEVTPSNTCGYGAARAFPLNVNLVPAQPGIISGSANPCQGSVQTYSVTNIPGVTYTWAVPDGSTITSGQGSYAITATIGSTSGNLNIVPSNSCGSGTEQIKSITIQLLPGIAATIYGPDLADLAHISTSDYTATAASDADSYLWELSPVAAGTINGTGITGTVIWDGGYLGTALVRVKALNACGEGGWSAAKSTEVINTTAITEISTKPGMIVYSFPGKGNFAVALSGMKQKTELRIFDLAGQVLYKSIISGTANSVVEYLPAPGVYLIQANDGSKTLTQKLIIR